MAARVYSKRLAEGIVIGGGSETVYTTPTDTVTVVRDVVITRSSGEAAAFLVLLTPTGEGSAIILVANDLLAPNRTVHWDLRQVARAGDELSVINVSGNVHWSISGYELVP